MSIKNRRMLELLEESLRKATPFLADSVSNLSNRFGKKWEDELETCLEVMWSDDHEGIAKAAEAYARFSLEAARQQAIFERKGKYQNGSFSQANTKVYQNKSYMEDQYLPGLLLSNYLWPHHYLIMSFFKEKFLPLIANSGLTRFVEVGVGTGIFSRMVLTTCRSAEGTAIDLSPYSLAFAERHMLAYGVENRCKLLQSDILSDETSVSEKPFVICVEVMEHLEDPTKLLLAIKKLIGPDGRGFITAALNAANLDHIYLYRDIGQIVAQLKDAGLSIYEQYSIDAYPPKGNHPSPCLAAFIIG